MATAAGNSERQEGNLRLGNVRLGELRLQHHGGNSFSRTLYCISGSAGRCKATPDGLARFLGIPVAPDSFLPYCISFSVGLQVLFLPILGAIADYSHMRKRMMQIFATIGAIATILMFFITGRLMVAGRRALHPCQPDLWRSDRFLQRLSAGYRQRRRTRPGFLLWLGDGLSGRRICCWL